MDCNSDTKHVHILKGRNPLMSAIPDNLKLPIWELLCLLMRCQCPKVTRISSTDNSDSANQLNHKCQHIQAPANAFMVRFRQSLCNSNLAR
mmetsp:Transcript_128477/g.256652  ORF Transcript_128477/g.256652 Transcript_128477/m.256652 type:complete len:91 (+) Transcript_128477:52-324(+)